MPSDVELYDSREGDGDVPAGNAHRESASRPPQPPTKNTFLGLGPVHADGVITRSTQPPGKATKIGMSADLSSDEATGSGQPSLKNTLLGPMAPPQNGNGAVAPRQPSLKNTITGPTPAPQEPVNARASESSLKATMMIAMGPLLSSTGSAPPAPSNRATELHELVADTVFATGFKVVRTIARGRVSTLYEAELQGSGRRCALKVLQRAPGVDEQSLQRFVHDARIASRVESEHMVEVTRAGFDAASGCPWIAMELLEGETLAARLARLGDDRPLPTAEAWRVLAGVCRGLAKAHHQGVIHGDLRPSNVFLAHDANDAVGVKLVDFGVSQLFSTWGDDGGPEAASWRAPEVSSREVTPAADVWSVGLLAFKVLTGKSYWQGTERIERLDQRIIPASARAEVLGCAELLPQGFDAWFAQCVSRVPASRFKSARELTPALATIQPAGRAVPVLDYTPSLGVNPNPVPLVQRKVTTRPSSPPAGNSARDSSEPALRPAFVVSPPTGRPAVGPRKGSRTPLVPSQSERTTPVDPSDSDSHELTIPRDAMRAATPLSTAPGSLRSPTPRGASSNTPPPAPRHTPSPSSPQKALSLTGQRNTPSPSSAHSALSTSGAQMVLSHSSAQRTLSARDAQGLLSNEGSREALAPEVSNFAPRSSAAPGHPPRHSAPLLTAPAPLVAATIPRPPKHRVKTSAVIGFLVGSFAMVALVLFIAMRQERHVSPPDVSHMAPLTATTHANAPLEVAPPTPPARSSRRWSGTLTIDDGEWSFVLSLRVSGTVATGWFAWTATRVAGVRPGEQVRENLEGTWDAATRAFDLHGTATTNPSLLPVNAYRMSELPDGALAGTTLDTSARLQAAPDRPAPR